MIPPFENVWRSDGLHSPGLPSPLADSFWGHAFGHQPLFFFLISAIKKIYIGTSLVVQWLRLCTSTAGGAGLIPGQGTVIPSAVHCGQKKKKVHLSFHFQHAPKLLSLSPPCRGGCIYHTWPGKWLPWTECLVHTLAYAWDPALSGSILGSRHCSEQVPTK